MNIPLIGRFVDERFLEHRRRSSSVAGIVSAELALLLFLWHFYVGHQVRWELLAIGLTFVAVKMSLFTWYRLHD